MLDIDINTLRNSVENDRIILRARQVRLDEFRQMDPRTILQTDRYLIEEWSMVSTREFVRILGQLEDDAIAAEEQADVIKELDKLIHLHDHLKQLAVDLRDYLNEILGPLPAPARRRKPAKKDKTAAASSSAGPSSTAGPSSSADPSPSLEPDSSVGPSSSPAPVDAQPAAAPEPVEHIGPVSRIPASIPATQQFQVPTVPAEQATRDENLPPLSASDLAKIGTPDPQGVYSMLNLPVDCTDGQISTAIKKRKALLHPDRHPDDPEAGWKFADFVVLVEETVATPAKRAMYDSVQDEDDMRDLVTRIGRLEAA